MTHPAPSEADGPRGFTVDEYLGLIDAGVLEPDDRTELLDGVVVVKMTHSPRHAAGVRRAERVLRAAVGDRAVVQGQLPVISGRRSVPEPDAAVLPGRAEDYDRAHPAAALLVVEVAESSLPQDRLTKSRIYAGAGIVEYWIVNLRHDRVEVQRDPDPATRRYATSFVAVAGARLELSALPGAAVLVDELLPPR